MIAVIFEALPHPERGEAYLDAAQQLRPLLADIDGFISIERFGSLAAPGKMLSLSFWRDEQAVRQWRNLDAHRRTQDAGRSTNFDDSRLRVAEVLRDNGLTQTDQNPTA